MLTAIGFVADLWILGTYALLARTGRALPFHWANAIGSVPIVFGEIVLGAYVPLVLTATFGVIGVFGVARRGRMVRCAGTISGDCQQPVRCPDGHCDYREG